MSGKSLILRSGCERSQVRCLPGVFWEPGSALKCSITGNRGDRFCALVFAHTLGTCDGYLFSVSYH